MNVLDNLRIAGRGLTSNRLRSALTVLGVLIGVAAVIILVAVGAGSSASVESSIKALGTNTITITDRGLSTSGTETQNYDLTMTDVKALENKQQAPDILSVSPALTTDATGVYGDESYSMLVTGTTPAYLTAEDDTLQAGQGITAAEVREHAKVVVIGQDVLDNLFPVGTNAIGKQIQLGVAQFQVVGVLASKGSSAGANEDDVAIAPYTTVMDQLTGEASTFSEVVVQASSANTTTQAQAQAEEVLASQNGTSFTDLPYDVVNQASLLSTSESTTKTFTLLLGAVAGISLLVGGIGVMNIMLVSVTERTREIGIRKAIGAPKSAILGQFLFESVLLSLIGGVAGVIVGVIGSQFKIVGVTPALAPYSIVLAFGVAVAVGVFFGFYPANRAAAMRPIDALRYE